MIKKNSLSYDKTVQWDHAFLTSKNFINFLQLVPEAVILSTESGEIILTNQVAQKLFQYTKTDFLQINIDDLVPDKIKAIHPKLRASFFENPTPRYLESRELQLSAQRKDGSTFPMESSLFAIQTDKGPIAVNLLRDISLQKADEAQMTQYAFVDTVTNLPNRRYFDDHIKRLASKVQRDKATLGLLYIDLDKFKPINDNYGHDIGDLILKTISSRLSQVLRAEDLIARVGGDEFILTIFPIPEQHYLDTIAKRILAACNQSIDIKNKQYQLSASIGIAFNTSSLFDEQKLIQLADKAMYHAKEQGGNCFAYMKQTK
ncbi:MAG: sensor domain-containing diguanylate cyclase [Legionellaceae bacterium]|nr:sensor domain-containing diguanylate cyclase [Legionellaceae bacterium]